MNPTKTAKAKYIVTNLIVLTVAGCYGRSIVYEQLTMPPQASPDDVGVVVRVSGGRFMMGAPRDAESRPESPRQGWIDLARPRHPEVVSDFELGKYEVTAREYCEFLNDLNRNGEPVSTYILMDTTSTVRRLGGEFVPRDGYELAPALHVQYEGAVRYCAWLTSRTGNSYRLPTEVEWEYAARGAEERIYPWGDEDALGRGYFRAHYRATDSPTSPGVVNVGTFPSGATPEGIHDMIGNAPEWCLNCFNEYSDGPTMVTAESRQEYLSPPADCAGQLHPKAGQTPCAAIRGGQYIDRSHVATSWTRVMGVKYGVRPGLARKRGTSFRVLKEVE